MFIQTITGKTSTHYAIVERGRVWERDLRPGAKGFLGSTMGVTSEGGFFVAARFESPEAARANSERPEQGAWWAETEKVVSDVEFHDCSTVATMLGGGSNDAGFVQVMCGRVTDRAKADQILSDPDRADKVIGAARPDVLGSTIALHDDDDGYAQIVYFTSETEARANEAKPWPPDAQAMMDEIQAAMDVTDFLDLPSPVMT